MRELVRVPTYTHLLTQLQNVQSLLVVSTFLVVQERQKPTRPEQFDLALRTAEHEADHGFHVDRLNHNSPTDIVLWAGAISGASAAVSLAANRLIVVWKNLWTARAAKSQAQLVIAANDALRFEIDSTRGKPLYRDDLPGTLIERIDAASRAIADAEAITLEVD